MKPIKAGLEGHGGGDLDGFVTGGADLEVDFVLAFEKDFAVVDATAGVHQAESAKQFARGQDIRLSAEQLSQMGL
jgi:hypothetical protein